MQYRNYDDKIYNYDKIYVIYCQFKIPKMICRSFPKASLSKNAIQNKLVGKSVSAQG